MSCWILTLVCPSSNILFIIIFNLFCTIYNPKNIKSFSITSLSILLACSFVIFITLQERPKTLNPLEEYLVNTSLKLAGNVFL